jgi:chromosome partitioning protein
MVVLIGGIKGGTGKSTIATNLAALREEKMQQKNVLLVDTDDQGSTADWAYYRSEAGIDGIECIQLFDKRIISEIRTKKERYSDIIIDAGGRDSAELRHSMSVSDVMIVPVRASQYDLNTIDLVDEMVEQTKIINPELRVVAVINNFPNHSRLTEGTEAIEFLKKSENISVADFIIHERISFSRSGKEGLGVNEMKNDNGSLADPKAVAELQKLYEVVYERI